VRSQSGHKNVAKALPPKVPLGECRNKTDFNNQSDNRFKSSYYHQWIVQRSCAAEAREEAAP